MVDAALHKLFGLEGKRALVTGASSGLGLHCARVLAAAGAEVVLAARRIDRLRELAADMPGKVSAVTMEVSDAHSVRRAFDEVCERLGAPDIILNNAGVTITKPALEQTAADFDSVLDTNLKGGWLVATEGARRMVAAGKGGVIINTASILGERVAGAVAPYSISKAGVVQATKALALELARYRIRVNALLPGYVVTDLNRAFLSSEAGERLRKRIPSRRFGELSDLDAPLLLLTGDGGRHITGATLAVDGGHLVSGL
ncbi:SDR family NAD(P)-dependent oxidoreductase [Pseudomonas umsongensis]|uniref:SDR family NAD(P)-dependent oxidoreductase n=1 Tax=Pseudomonas umsongensis TaxID=198618 RepID=UPI002009F3AF|nr:SDR family oxidoreductase [Pseudomonas umsongensis]MCK8682705.1 SDR family oxidoreductase [Pseudomonas umsongensis]